LSTASFKGQVEIESALLPLPGSSAGGLEKIAETRSSTASDMKPLGASELARPDSGTDDDTNSGQGVDRHHTALTASPNYSLAIKPPCLLNAGTNKDSGKDILKQGESENLQTYINRGETLLSQHIVILENALVRCLIDGLDEIITRAAATEWLNTTSWTFKSVMKFKSTYVSRRCNKRIALPEIQRPLPTKKQRGNQKLRINHHGLHRIEPRRSRRLAGRTAVESSHSGRQDIQKSAKADCQLPVATSDEVENDNKQQQPATDLNEGAEMSEEHVGLKQVVHGKRHPRTYAKKSARVRHSYQHDVPNGHKMWHELNHSTGSPFGLVGDGGRPVKHNDRPVVKAIDRYPRTPCKQYQQRLDTLEDRRLPPSRDICSPSPLQKETIHLGAPSFEQEMPGAQPAILSPKKPVDNFEHHVECVPMSPSPYNPKPRLVLQKRKLEAWNADLPKSSLSSPRTTHSIQSRAARKLMVPVETSGLVLVGLGERKKRKSIPPPPEIPILSTSSEVDTKGVW
jgi:hypothetical protein